MTVRKIFSAALLLTLAACGGSGNGPGDGTNGASQIDASKLLTVGSYKLSFSALSTARLEAPISGISVALKLPAGISVSTGSGGTGPISSSSLTPGSAIQATALVFGSFSASTRTAYLSMATSQDGYRSGKFLELLFTVASGATVTPGDIFALNATFPQYKVVGLNPVTHSTVVMSGHVRTTLGVDSLGGSAGVPLMPALQQAR